MSSLNTSYARFNCKTRDSPLGYRHVCLITLTRKLNDNDWIGLEERIKQIYISHWNLRIVINIELGYNERRKSEEKLLAISRNFTKLYPWINPKFIKIQLL